MNDLACRLCRKPLLAQSGCGVCNTWRKNLVVLGETDEERPALADVSNDAINALRAQLRDYRGRLKTEKDQDERDKLHGMERSVSGALSKLLDAARKLQSDGVMAVERMSFKERAELFIGWFMTLPPVYRNALREQMTAHEAQLALPAGEETLQ